MELRRELPERVAAAEDAAQDAYLRWHAADRDAVSDPPNKLRLTLGKGQRRYDRVVRRKLGLP